MKIILFGLILVLSASCIHLNPRFKSENNFNGLEKKFQEIEGVETQYCFVIHGIGHQEQNYSYKLMNGVSKNLLNKGYTSEIQPLIEKNLEKCSFTSKDKTKKIVYYSITWSSWSDLEKEALIAQEENHNPTNWNISDYVKHGVMIERAGDLFFASRERIFDQIFDIVNVGINDMLNENPEVKMDNLNIISGSLGSQVFIKILKRKFGMREQESVDSLSIEDQRVLLTEYFLNQKFEEHSNIVNYCISQDEITQINQDVELKLDNGFINVDLNSILLQENNFIGNICYNNTNQIYNSEQATQLNFYMLTNQFGLMGENLKNWGGKEYDKICFKKANFTAFRNPNDMLCYYLPKKLIYEEASCEGKDIHVTNLYYWNFLFRNNILSAHVSPFKLNKMYHAISFGSRKVDGKFKWVKNIGVNQD